MVGSNFNDFDPFVVFKPIIRCDIVFPYPPCGFSVSTGVNSVTSPS